MLNWCWATTIVIFIHCLTNWYWDTAAVSGFQDYASRRGSLIGLKNRAT